VKSNFKILLPISFALTSLSAFALPIDWHASFGVDSTLINYYRRIEALSEVTASSNGSQEVKLASGKKDSSSFQSYVFKLAPDIIVNDATSLKAEFTTGYANGGFLGDSAQSDKTATGGPSLYYYNQAKASSVNMQQLYMELNSDTATYHIGRHTYNWALGAVYNDGKNLWDRHAYSRDGITMFFKFNNFYITPFWSNNSNTGMTRAEDSKEFGTSLLYDNKDKEIAFGVNYSKKTDNAYNTFYVSNIGSAASNLGKTEVKLFDLYFKKTFGKFDFALEAPLFSGELGHVIDQTQNTSYSAKAIVMQANYILSETITVGIDAGNVSGHDGSNAKFQAMYLNPNFQVANLLFRYNMNAYGDSTQSIYDSYITNARYFKLKGTLNTEKWTLDSGLIFAKALEVAKAGGQAFNHQKGKIFTATTTQSDSLGTEIDLNAKYRWNKEVTLGGSFGYLFTGDYFSYTNDATNKNTAKNSMVLQANIGVQF
jgi:hypothetical protein